MITRTQLQGRKYSASIAGRLDRVPAEIAKSRLNNDIERAACEEEVARMKAAPGDLGRAKQKITAVADEEGWLPFPRVPRQEAQSVKREYCDAS
jgi:hypothetical protein